MFKGVLYMISFLMLGSLVLSLIAWILPVVSLKRYEKHNNRNGISFFMSLGACAVSLCFQIIYNNHLVKIGDLSALLDTSGASTMASVVLLIVTIILNIIALFARG